MNKIIILSILISIGTIAIGQNIQVGASGHLGIWQQYTNLNTSITKNKWVIRPSIKYGDFGKNDSISPGGVEVSGYPANTPSTLDKPFSNQYAYTTFWSSTINRGVSPELKLGRNFSKENSKSIFSVYLALAYYFINDDYKTYHRGYKLNNINETDLVTASSTVKHQNFSLGLSLGYSYAVAQKLNIEFMLNLPYYQPITTDQYNPDEFGVNPQNPKSQMLNSINYDISIGINYQLK